MIARIFYDEDYTILFLDDEKVFEGEQLELATLLNLLIDKTLTDVYEYTAVDGDEYSFKKCKSLHDYIECSLPLPI